MAAEDALLPLVAHDVINFRGHAMVRSTHPTTIEVTTEEDLTENGDCIIGVGASKGCSGLDPAVRDLLRKQGAVVSIRLVAGGESFELRARGDPMLELSDPHETVIRRSSFVSGRTVALGASAAARDIPRRLVSLLKDPKTKAKMEIEVR